MARKKIIPKKIGGVRVPKRVRRFANRTLADPRTAEVASGALIAIGAALAARKGGSIREAVAGALGGGDGSRGDPVRRAVGRVAEEVLDALRHKSARRAGPDAAPAGDAAEPAPDDDRVH